MDKRIFMVMLFSFLVCLSVIVLLTCIWKLIKLFAKVKVEQQIEDLEELSCKHPTGNPDGSKTSPSKNVHLYMSPKEARNLRRLSILAGFDRTSWSSRRKSVSCSPFRSHSNTTQDQDCERGISQDNSIETATTDISGVIRSANESPGILFSALTCGCCIPIHERLSKLFLQSSESDQEINHSRVSKSGRMSSKRREKLGIESDGSPSHQYKYNQSETSDEHLELIEKDCEAGKTLGGKSKFYNINYNNIIMYYLIFYENVHQ